jgi:hypothetical protein
MLSESVRIQGGKLGEFFQSTDRVLGSMVRVIREAVLRIQCIAFPGHKIEMHLI